MTWPTGVSELDGISFVELVTTSDEMDHSDKGVSHAVV